MLQYGFFYNGGCGDGCENKDYPVTDFPIMFDTNFNVSRVATYLTLLSEGNYIDDYTTALKVTVPMINPEVGRFVLIRVVFQPQAIGNWDMEYKIDVIPVSVNNWRGAATDGLDAWQCLMEVTFILFFFVLWYIEVKEIRTTIMGTGYVFAYVFDAANMLDWVNYFCQIGFISYWFRYMVALDDVASEIEFHYDVYSDYMAVARLTEMTADMGRFQRMVRRLENVIHLRQWYADYLAVALLLTVMQTLKNVDFHPKLGIVTRTVKQAFSDLVFFFVLFFLIVIICTFPTTQLLPMCFASLPTPPYPPLPPYCHDSCVNCPL